MSAGYREAQRYWEQRSRLACVLANASGPFFDLGTGKPRKERRAAWRRLRASANAQRNLSNDALYRESGTLSLVDILDLRGAKSPQGNVAYVRHPDHASHVASSRWWREMWTRAEVG